MTLIVWTQLAYLGISIALTVWVARTLHKNGRIFLVDCFHGNEGLADSVNHLLVVGFYLINVGFVALALRFGVTGANLQDALECLSTKIGFVLLVLGVVALGTGWYVRRSLRPSGWRMVVDVPGDRLGWRMVVGGPGDRLGWWWVLRSLGGRMLVGVSGDRLVWWWTVQRPSGSVWRRRRPRGS